MTEQSPDYIPAADLDAVDDYEEGLLSRGFRVAKSASQHGEAPDPDRARRIRPIIGRKISEVLKATVDVESSSGLDELKEEYWKRSWRVDVEYGAAATDSLDYYFTLDTDRHFDDMKSRLIESGTLNETQESLLDFIGKESLENHKSPSIVVSSILRKLSRSIRQAKEDKRINGQDDPSSQMHKLHDIIEWDFKTLLALDEQGMTMPLQEISDPLEDMKLLDDIAISESDAAFLWALHDIENKPYSKTELEGAHGILMLPEMQETLIRLHEGIIDESASYLRKHPERLTGNMASFSEIFIVDYKNEDDFELLPNPKFIQLLGKNIMPAIAKSMLERGIDFDSLEPDDITPEDISSGITLATKEYNLLSTYLPSFKKQDSIMRLKSIDMAVCPAHNYLPNFLTRNLETVFESSKQSASQLVNSA